MFRTLDDQVQVAGQIAPEDVAEAAAQGVRRIVNNRPDGEEPSQPGGDTIRAAAEAAGLDYVAVPMGHGGLSQEQVEAMAAALDDGAKTLAFCRSGTRSTILWSLAKASRGAEPVGLIAAAAEAGYDLAPYAQTLSALHARATG
ncbi:TIGR01244 family sulfur transferase [Sphingomonas jatrophae]|uniref:TIGR01244 family protein n=1 Tax=Sphingomonas jatrophae TaxID=1166337 RepID=A0A1I6LQ26_9SPHN|nr:TIGR01244 family sulfur transferase [Sphingomonas jatrophae]SFS05499.1 TIGR01244 family protein [Sphingomonas jatrophae]